MNARIFGQAKLSTTMKAPLSKAQVEKKLSDDLQSVANKAQASLNRATDEVVNRVSNIHGSAAAVHAFKLQMKVGYDAKVIMIMADFEAEKIRTANRSLQDLQGQVAAGVDTAALVQKNIANLVLHTPQLSLGATAPSNQAGGAGQHKINGLEIYIAVVVSLSAVGILILCMQLKSAQKKQFGQ
jgi:hypothetical protein